MTRVKPASNITPIKTLEEADGVLARIAERRRDISLIETGMNEQIDEIKTNAAEEAEPYRLEIATLEQRLSNFAQYHKEEFFAKPKSRDLTFGALGFRSSSKIKLLAKMTWERVLQSLRDTGMTDCIRLKAEPDKEALKGLSPERLKELGCKVVQEDIFFYEIADQALTDTGEAA